MLQKLKGHENVGYSDISIDALLNSYQLTLTAMNRSRKTISWYTEILKRYFAFLESSNLLKPLAELGIEEVKAYIINLQQAVRWPNNPHIMKEKGKLSPHSIQGHIRAIKAFWSWLAGEGYIEQNPVAKFPLPKVPKNIIKTLTIVQIKGLLNQLDRHTS